MVSCRWFLKSNHWLLSHSIPLAIAVIANRLCAARFSRTVRESGQLGSLVHSDAHSAQEDKKRLLKRASGFICSLPQILHDSTWFYMICSVDLKNRKTIEGFKTKGTVPKYLKFLRSGFARFCLLPRCWLALHKLRRREATTMMLWSLADEIPFVIKYAPLDPFRSTATQLAGFMCAIAFSFGTRLHTQEMTCFPRCLPMFELSLETYMY